VGADGRGSRLARTVQTLEYDVTPTLTCWYFSYWSGVVASGLELYVRPERVIFAFPTNDDLFAIFIAWPIDCQRVVRADLERQFISVIDLVPDLAERVRAGQRRRNFRAPPTCQTYAQTLRSRMGLGRRCRLPQGSLSGAGHLRRLSRRRTPR
jgi:hypothetical protein